MSVIDDQNKLQIRAPMSVSCGIAARPNINLSITNMTGFVIEDLNPAASVKSDDWPVREITDLQGEGFSLDGSCSFYEQKAGSEDGKTGLKTHIGGTGSLTVSASQEIPALTIYTRGSGTITAGGTSYEARGVNVIPVNAMSVSITFASTDSESRMEVFTIIPGINLSWSNNDLVSVELNLRSDLSIDNSQWAVSEIDISAYYPEDISEAVSTIADNVPLWYTAGYPGNMSPERRFYLSEPVTMKDGIISLKGRDASAALSKTANAAQIVNTKSGTGRRTLYNKLAELIQNAGITLRSKESAPVATSGTVERSLVIKAGSSDSIVQNIINLAHAGTYWPTFVDAGIPRLYHSKPTQKWTIKEEDCGNVQRIADRNVSRIASHDDYGLHSRITRNTKWQELFRLKVDANTRYVRNAGGYYWYLSATNARDVVTTAESIRWTAVETTSDGRPITKYEIDDNGNVKEITEIEYLNESVIKGKGVTIEARETSVLAEPRRAGITLVVSPIAYGMVYTENNVFLYPNYRWLFGRSNITGSFTWKGDPRMQPRDVFEFERLDGTKEICTIESIRLTHAGGGTVSEIAYRLGVC